MNDDALPRYTDVDAHFFDSFDEILTGEAIPAMTEAALDLSRVLTQLD